MARAVPTLNFRLLFFKFQHGEASDTSVSIIASGRCLLLVTYNLAYV
uniref:Uncharacterized protein n=1 Tax=Ascaris lumbricoides TaxID=6252 RepID=A0A0M3HG68_ASCLU